MRKGLTLTLGVVLLAAMASVSFAGAPLFTGVPGVINIGGSEGGGRVYTDVFGFQTVAKTGYNVDWSFSQTVGATGLSFRANGIDPVADASGAVAPASPLQDAGTSFTIKEIGGGSGMTTAAAAYGNMVAGVDAAATINVYASDGDAVSARTVLVTVTDAGTDSADIFSSSVVALITGKYPPQWKTQDDGNSAGFVQPGGLTFTTTDNGYMVERTTGGGIDDLGYGAVLSPYPLSPVVAGKQYLLNTHVVATSITLSQQALYLKFIFGEGFDLANLTDDDPGFGAQAITEIPSEDWTSSLLSPMGGRDYSVIYAPPQDAGVEGNNLSATYRVIAFGNKWHTETVGFTPDSTTGGVIFSNTVITCVDIPAVGSGTMLADWTDNNTTSSTTSFNVNGQVAQSSTDVAGWKANAYGFTMGTTHGQADPTRLTATAAGTSAATLTATGFTLTSDMTGMYFVSYLNGDPNLIDNAATDTSAISQSMVQSLAGTVWYRLSVTMTASNDDLTSNPNFRVRLGNPYGRYDNALSIRETDAASAISSTPRVYQVWMKGVPLSAWDTVFPDINNLMAAVEIIDTGDGLGETYTIDEAVLEAFPLALIQ